MHEIPIHPRLQLQDPNQSIVDQSPKWERCAWFQWEDIGWDQGLEGYTQRNHIWLSGDKEESAVGLQRKESIRRRGSGISERPGWNRSSSGVHIITKNKSTSKNNKYEKRFFTNSTSAGRWTAFECRKQGAEGRGPTPHKTVENIRRWHEHPQRKYFKPQRRCPKPFQRWNAILPKLKFDAFVSEREVKIANEIWPVSGFLGKIDE